jgi:predicted NAD/FAD-dependent oxidoreductase
MSETHDVVVIGGGQAGLVASHALTERSLDHVVLERDRVCLAGSLSSRLPTCGWCGSFMACVPAGHRGEAWLKKGRSTRNMVEATTRWPLRSTGRSAARIRQPPFQSTHSAVASSRNAFCW